MFTKTKKLTILFADIAGSTKLYDSLGDVRAREIVSSTLDILRQITDRYRGTVIKTIGDEIMCTFGSAEDAVNAANDMQMAMEDALEENPDGPVVLIKVGLHHGPAIPENGDVHGDAVNVAARMASQAKPRQIITTGDTAKQLPAVLQESIRFVDNAPVKGKGMLEIVEVLWQEEDCTRMSVDISSVGAQTGNNVQLQIRYRDEDITLNTERDAIVLGRSPICDLQVREALASRQHVRIEQRRDRFFIIDQSTNGTYIRQADGAESFLRREELPLMGEGEISLGRAFSDDAREIVHFAYRTE